MRKLSAENLFLGLVLFLAALTLLYKIDKPFWGHHDWNGAYWGNVARNYARYGPVTTKLAMVENVGETPPANFSYTFHYSPLYPLTVGAFFRVLGEKEWVMRLVSVLASVFGLFVFHKTVRLFFDRRVAASAVILWIVTPMFIYFGKIPAHEPLELLFSLLTIYFYLSDSFRKAVLFLILAELTTWPGYFLVPAITVYWWFFGGRRNVKQILVFWLVSLGAFASLLVHDYLVTGSPFGGGLGEIFFLRVKSVPVGPYVAQLLRWLITYYVWLPVLTLPGLALLAVKNKRHLALPILLLVYAVIYPIIFRDASFRHDYLLSYFLPFLTLLAAIFLSWLFPGRLLIIGVLAVALSAVIIRLRFISALEASDIYRESVRLGIYIEQHSAPSERAVVAIYDPSVGFDGWFISYYADRHVSVAHGQWPVVDRAAKFEYRAGGIVLRVN